MVAVAWVLRLVVVLVFTSSVLGKLRTGAPGLNEQAAVIRLLGVPRPWTRLVAVATVVAEAGVAAMTAIPTTAIVGCAGAVLLTGVLTSGVGRLVAARSGATCRCFGGAGTVLGIEHVIRNATLMTVALAALVTTMLSRGAGVVSAPTLALLAIMAAALAACFVFWDDLAAVVRFAGPEG